MLLSVSDLKLYARCPQLFHFAVIQRRGVSGGWSKALHLGTIIHATLESKLKDGDFVTDSALALALATETAPTPEAAEELAKAFAKIWPGLLEWEPNPAWKIVAVEKELRMDFCGHTIVGRLDTIIDWDDAYWHLQHKSIDGSKPTSVFAESVRTDWHESWYQLLALENGYTDKPWGGTLLNLIVKRTKKDMDAGRPGFEFKYLTRDCRVVDDCRSHTQQMLHDIGQEVCEDRFIEKRRPNCLNSFGWSCCAYKPVCDYRADIDGPGFITSAPRYMETEE